jgi:hypothetical protein
MIEVKKAEKMDRGKEILRKTGAFILRWFYLGLFLGVAVYAVWIWNKFILNADWSEEKKQAYISEQSVFSFDSNGYQQATDLINSRKEKLNSHYKFTGQDIFFPDGF